VVVPVCDWHHSNSSAPYPLAVKETFARLLPMASDSESCLSCVSRRSVDSFDSTGVYGDADVAEVAPAAAPHRRKKKSHAEVVLPAGVVYRKNPVEPTLTQETLHVCHPRLCGDCVRA